MAASPAQVSADRFPDLSPLVGPVDATAVDALRRSASAADHRYFVRETASVIGSIVAAALMILGTFGALVIAPPMMATMFSNLTPGTVALSLVCTGAAVAIIMSFGRTRVNAVRSRLLALGNWTRRWRMSSFAASNGLSYSARPTNIPPIGSVLTAAKATYSDLFAVDIEGRTTLLGNAKSHDTTTAGHAPYGWFFGLFRLEAKMPHMMMVPQGLKLHALGMPLFNIAGKQRLRLEGDWDRHFALYVPQQYERDAIYTVTPDLMVLLIDYLPGAYIEVFADCVVITAPGSLDFAEPDTWKRISRLIDAVLPKTLRQTRNYRDERSAVRGDIAPQGRALRPGLPIVSAISVIAIVTQILLLAFR